MQHPPTGYGQSPQWNGQPQQPFPQQQDQLNQGPYIPYPQQQQGYAPQQPYPPQQGQWQQPPPNMQWQQPYGQPSPQQPKKKRNVMKYVVFAFSILVAIVFLLFIIGAIAGNKGSTASSTLSEPEYKASAIDITVANLDKDSNADKGKDVHFTATIINFVKDSNGNTAGANVDNGFTSGVVQVEFPSGTDLSKVNTGDTIEVWGFDQGSFSGTNGFGATVQEVAVSAVYMTDQTTTYQIA